MKVQRDWNRLRGRAPSTIPYLNDYTHNDYKNNLPHPQRNHPMKFYNREDELQELNLLRNAMPSMIVLTGRRRVGKTELIKKFLESETGVYFFVDSENPRKC